MSVKSTYIPFSAYAFLSDGEKMTIEFDMTSLDVEQDDCTKKIRISCDKQGIENLTKAIIDWKKDCGSRYLISTDDEYVFLTLALVTDENGLVTGINLVVFNPILSSKNFFTLYGIVDDKRVILARGTIYCSNFLDIAQTPVFETPDTDDVITIDEYVVGEVPSGAIDGINATFITEFDFVPESIAVFINGILQDKIDNYNTSGANTIQMVTSPNSDDSILVDYIKA